MVRRQFFELAGAAYLAAGVFACNSGSFTIEGPTHSELLTERCQEYGNDGFGNDCIYALSAEEAFRGSELLESSFSYASFLEEVGHLTAQENVVDAASLASWEGISYLDAVHLTEDTLVERKFVGDNFNVGKYCVHPNDAETDRRAAFYTTLDSGEGVIVFRAHMNEEQEEAYESTGELPDCSEWPVFKTLDLETFIHEAGHASGSHVNEYEANHPSFDDSLTVCSDAVLNGYFEGRDEFSYQVGCLVEVLDRDAHIPSDPLMAFDSYAFSVRNKLDLGEITISEACSRIGKYLVDDFASLRVDTVLRTLGSDSTSAASEEYGVILFSENGLNIDPNDLRFVLEYMARDVQSRVRSDAEQEFRDLNCD